MSQYEPLDIFAFNAGEARGHSQDIHLDIVVVMDTLPDSPFNVKMDIAGKVFDILPALEKVDFMISAYPFSKAQFEGSEESVFSRLIPQIRQNGILIPYHI